MPSFVNLPLLVQEIVDMLHYILNDPRNVITNDVICVPYVTTLLKRSGKATIYIALVHSCDLLHCVTALPGRRLCDKPVYVRTT